MPPEFNREYENKSANDIETMQPKNLMDFPTNKSDFLKFLDAGKIRQQPSVQVPACTVEMIIPDGFKMKGGAECSLELVPMTAVEIEAQRKRRAYEASAEYKNDMDRLKSNVHITGG